MPGIFIAGTGMYVPPKVVTNDDMAKIVETSDEWIVQRTGIRQRHFSQGETNGSMGVKAAREALANAGVNAADLDVIIGCTVTPDFYYPSLACVVQSEIGAENAFAFDLNAACSGFIYALDAARNYLAPGVGEKKSVLIVCSEEMSKVLDFSDRSACVLFGDGAAAAVVQPGEDRLFASYLRSEGKLGAAIVSRALACQGPFAEHADDPAFELYEKTAGPFIKMHGSDVYRFAVRALPEAVEKACEKAGVPV